MGDSKDMFFDLPPLPGHGTTTSGTSADKTVEARAIKSKEKGGKDTGKVRVESSGLTKPPPNLGTFKILIAITWLLFFACVIGIIYVLVEYKSERDALRAKSDHVSSS